ncbi:hypothetical protein pEaSNUABM29_00199 [Erwinia phage pEa_SNUABM_29]|nr:hypothetical protein pEaSNUABM29_00199 [Erwinia phage pEa_SNUABM_29]
MAGELGRGQTTTFMHVDGLGVDVPMQKEDEFSLPGLDPNLTVEGGVDAAKDDESCPGGACKI